MDGEEVDRIGEEVIRDVRDAPTERDAGELWGRRAGVSCCEATRTGEWRTDEGREGCIELIERDWNEGGHVARRAGGGERRGASQR